MLLIILVHGFLSAIILVQGSLSTELVKITQFPGGFRLDTYTFTNNRSSATFEK